LTHNLTELAVLIDDPRAHPKADIEHIQKWSAEQQEAIKNQIAEAKCAKESGPVNSRSTSEEALQKRRAREEKKLAQAARAAEAAATFESLLMPESDSVSHDAPAEPDTQSATASIPYTVVIPTASSSLEWYNPDAHAYTSIEAAKGAGVWNYPSNLQERARCGVFRGLWEKGYFMGGGIKFGGDYLVYPGISLCSFHLKCTDLVL
jgi:tRNA-splicing endonuclease subunit Sen34